MPHRLLLLALLAGCDTATTDDLATDDLTDTGESAPCTAVIPASAVVVTSPQDFNASGGDAWVCGSGGAATVNASGGTYFVESGGLLTGNSGSFVIYADDGAQITLNAAADVELYRTPGATVSINAASVDETECSRIDFDTTNAPASGC